MARSTNGGITDKVSYSLTVARRAVTDSLLSYSGARNEASGLEWGGVTSNGGALPALRETTARGACTRTPPTRCSRATACRPTTGVSYSLSAVGEYQPAPLSSPYLSRSN
ncbi:cellulose synthase subunit BcsC-related outer membrane protein [Paraburkholderia sp. SIMBA_030]|uniref:cellulose synthase subunit BcsC-related outer membrane protein n=1 Tax=Paraburkholderia sp. SIMBA_030 TaxID=3085773 RepID=UPI00397CE8FF